MEAIACFDFFFYVCDRTVDDVRFIVHDEWKEATRKWQDMASFLGQFLTLLHDILQDANKKMYCEFITK